MVQNRAMALDVGSHRIGVAVSDPMRITANGIETYKRTGDDEKDAVYLADLANKYAPLTLVFGLPRNMNGTYGPQAEKTREFAALVGKYFAGEIEFYDERLTTAAAERVLLEADVSRKKRKNVIDKMAAVIILQGYLEYSKSRAH